MKAILSIDPGYNGTAYALWPKRHFAHSEPIRVGTIKPSDHETVEGAEEIVEALWRDLNKYEIIRVGIEFPKIFGGSAVSMASAQSGDLFKLTYLVGALGNTFRGRGVELIPVNTWKGQLPKEVCQQRIMKILGGIDYSKWDHHAWDAVGIGLFMGGRFG